MMKYSSLFLRAGFTLISLCVVSCHYTVPTQAAANVQPQEAKPLPGWAKGTGRAESKQELVISTKVIEITRDIASEDIPAERYQRKLTAVEFQKYARELSQIKGVDILTAPKVVVRDGKNSLVRIGREFVFTKKNSSSATNEAVASDYATEEIGVTSHARASHLGGQKISLKTFTRVSEVDGFSGATSEQNDPIFNRREIEAISTLKSGETLVIGGLLDETTQTVQDVSFFGLASKTYPQQLSRELIVAVTAELAD